MASATQDKARGLLTGAYDMHLHAAPDGYGRNVDYIEAAEDAADLNMKAIVFKDHHFPTVGLARMTNKIVPEIDSMGSITISNSIGGFNAEAVREAVKRGARAVWFPTLDSPRFVGTKRHSKHLDFAHVERSAGPGYPPLHAITPEGEVLKEVVDVLSIVRESGVLLGLAYMSRAEAVPVIKKAQEMGIDRIVFSHPQSVIGLPLSHQTELVNMGVYLAFNYLNCYVNHGDLPVEDLAEMIRSAGDYAVLSSSGGQASLPTPAELMLKGTEALLNEGIQEAQLKKMLQTNPAYLLRDG
ncbi:DUF6282 family protein [Christensenellaceae bacterium OttesenSCG-928-M15]|nr:DUF6282 family protein [Christensenellaceae bacterium OttesenSCG-928-M15]